MQTVKQEFSEKLHPGKEFYTSVIDRLICLCVHEKGPAIQKKPQKKNAYARVQDLSQSASSARLARFILRGILSIWVQTELNWVVNWKGVIAPRDSFIIRQPLRSARDTARNNDGPNFIASIHRQYETRDWVRWGESGESGWGTRGKQVTVWKELSDEERRSARASQSDFNSLPCLPGPIAASQLNSNQ